MRPPAPPPPRPDESLIGHMEGPRAAAVLRRLASKSTADEGDTE